MWEERAGKADEHVTQCKLNYFEIHNYGCDAGLSVISRIGPMHWWGIANKKLTPLQIQILHLPATEQKSLWEWYEGRSDHEWW